MGTTHPNERYSRNDGSFLRKVTSFMLNNQTGTQLETQCPLNTSSKVGGHAAALAPPSGCDRSREAKWMIVDVFACVRAAVSSESKSTPWPPAKSGASKRKQPLKGW